MDNFEIIIFGSHTNYFKRKGLFSLQLFLKLNYYHTEQTWDSTVV